MEQKVRDNLWLKIYPYTYISGYFFSCSDFDTSTYIQVCMYLCLHPRANIAF